MKGGINKFYSIYEDGKLIFHGTASECAKHLNISNGAFTHRLRGTTATKYEIIEESKANTNKLDEKIYQSVLKHLSLYGNTIVTKRSGYIFNRLKEDGIKVKMHKSDYGNYWIVEREDEQ